MRYSCLFAFGVGSGKMFYFTDVPSIGDIKDGFWIDESREFTKSSGSKYWIPPSAIMHVEKISDEE
jgi:hypothetical protein